MSFVFNILISATAISFASWLSGRSPALAGFMIAMPVATLIVLPMSYAEHRDANTSVELARSIFVAIPVTLTFFVPFLLSGRLGISFWQACAIGCAALPVGFFVHRALTRLI